MGVPRQHDVLLSLLFSLRKRSLAENFRDQLVVDTNTIQIGIVYSLRWPAFVVDNLGFESQQEQEIFMLC